MNIIYANDRGVLEIGYAGEMDRTEVRFFYGDLEEEFPGGTVLLQVKRPNEDTKYDLLLPATDGEEYTSSWIVSEYDCGIRGVGECQLIYTTGEAIAKRKIWRTHVVRSIEGSNASIPPDWEDIEARLLSAAAEVNTALGNTKTYVDSATEDADRAANAAQQSAEDAERQVERYNNMRVSVQTLPETSDATANMDHTDPDAPLLRLGIPRGATGPRGLQGPPGPQGSPTDKQTADAVSVWLDEHPEATTTVQDGEITLPKLNNSLQDIVTIRVQDAKGYYHDNSPSKVKVYPNEYTQDIPVRYTESENLIESSNIDSGVNGGITRTKDGRIIKVSGTGTGGFQFFHTTNASFLSRLAGKTVKVCMYLNKATGFAMTSYLSLRVNDTTSILRVNFGPSGSELKGWHVWDNVVFPAELTRVRLYFNSLKDTEFIDGDFFWIGIYETDPIISDVIVSTDPVDIDIEGLTKIDTMMHESEAEYIVPTKQYIDTHIPDIIGYWSENIYVMPEWFGAVGDGVTDDTNALIDCIAYAGLNSKAVKGFRRYKISNTLVINAQYLDVYLREVNNVASCAAVEIQHMDVKFEFHRITSTGTGICLTHNSDSTAKYARRCVIKGNEVNCDSDCVITTGMTLYNTFEIRYVSSTNGDCYKFIFDEQTDSFSGGESVFMNSSCACPNGYVLNGSANNSKFYNFTIEANCKYGIKNIGPCTCIGFRHREQVDGMKLRIIDGRTDRNNGALITHTANDLYSLKYISNDPIPWFSIDASAGDGYDRIPSGESSTDRWLHMAYSGIELGVPVRGVDAQSRKIYGEKVFFIGRHKVFAPEARCELVLSSASYDMRLFDSMEEADIKAAARINGWATDFIAGNAHTDYYCNASFGAVGYNDLTITQENGNTVTFYDKLGNVLFDGTNLGDGKWRLTCVMDRSSCGRLDYQTAWWGYDGTNEKWTIEKIG